MKEDAARVNLSGIVMPSICALLMRPLDPSRVKKDNKGFSYLEAWDIRRTMNAIFGAARWSAEVRNMELVYESDHVEERKGKQVRLWDVCYRASCEVTVNGHVYTEWASGAATNYPSRADAHDQALKTAESQAFKRACVNLGDQFGLSLYNDGSTEAVVAGMVAIHETSRHVQGWLDRLQSAATMETLAEVAAELRQADLSTHDRDVLVKAYKESESRLAVKAVADLLPDPKSA